MSSEDKSTRQSGSNSSWKSILSSQLLKNGAIVMASLYAFIWLSKTVRNWKRKYSAEYKEKSKQIVQQAGEHSTVAQQDSNAIIGLMHSSEGIGALQAAKTLMPEQHLVDLTGISVNDLESQLRMQQREAIKAIGSQCPRTKPNANAISVASWLNT
jgi:hypothetical protein